MSEKKSLGAEEIISERKIGRRSMAMLGGAAAGAVAALGIVTTTACCMGGTGGTPAVSGCSDTDPSDPGGNGRHCGAGAVAPMPPPSTGVASGCSDTDPTDPAGNGSHCR